MLKTTANLRLLEIWGPSQLERLDFTTFNLHPAPLPASSTRSSSSSQRSKSRIATDSMGNCCGRASSDSNNFSTPGRTLGAVPTNDVPQNPSRVAKPSTTGSENNLRLQGGGVSGSGPSEARAAAARAAEVSLPAAVRTGIIHGGLADQLLLFFFIKVSI